MKNQLKLIYIVCCVVLGCFLNAFTAFSAGETLEEKTSGNVREGSFYLGFRWIDADVLKGVAEYEDPESSLVLGGRFEHYPLPHRYHIEGEYLGSDDYYGDFGYSYSDIVLFRNVLVGLHHNLEHYNYINPGERGLRYIERSPGDENYVDFTKNNLFFRLKTPNFPLHAFLKHKYVQRDGSMQERFLLGYFGNLNKTSESRDIDWKSNDLTLGVDSHLGPIEAEYTHSRFEFDPGAGSVLYDFDSSGRPPDTYPHMVIPETESYSNSLKLHTSYTGQIVATASLSNEESTNNYSGAEVDAWKAAFDLQWIPDPVISMFFRYRHLDRDKENPDHVTLRGSFSRRPYEVRTPVSIEKDLLSLSARYRPTGIVTLIGKYEYEMRDREDIDEWVVLPEESDVHRVNLTAHVKPMKGLKVKGKYQYRYYEDPSYNTEPDHYNKLSVKASYTPNSWVSALIDYSMTISQREDLIYVNSGRVIADGERDGRTHQALGSMSFLLSTDTSLTASWAYNRWKTEHDTAYSRWDPRTGGTTALPYYDSGAPYTDQAHVFALSLNSKLRKDLSLKAGLSHMIAESEYLPTPSYLTFFATKDTAETVATVELAKKIMEDWEVGLKLKAGYFDDEYSDHASGDNQDGEFYLTTLMLKRYF